MRGEAAGQSLQATALVSEAYVRLVDVRRMNWTNRIHFLAMAARIMRRILVDSARARHSQKRGGAIARVSLDEECVAIDAPDQSLLALSDALDRLSAVDGRKGQVVELRFFGGLTVGRNRSGIECLRRHGDARLEARQGLAAQGARGRRRRTVDRAARQGRAAFRTSATRLICGDRTSASPQSGTARIERRRVRGNVDHVVDRQVRDEGCISATVGPTRVPCCMS